MRTFKRMDKGALTDVDMKKRGNRILYYAMLLILIVVCLISVLPVLWIILSGFKDTQEMYSVPASFLPKHIKLSKLAKVWTEMKFYKYYLTTFVMAAGAAFSDILVCGLAGYVLSRLKPRGSKVIFMICFWVMLLPGTMRTVPLYITFRNMKLLDSYVPIWIMAAANAFDIILFKNFFDSISSSLIEAGRIDGASNLRIFFKIVMPLSIPVFMVVGILGFNAQIGNFFWPYLLISKPELRVLGVQIFKMQGSGNYTMDYQMLAILFSVLPQVVIFAIFQKHIMGGVNIGGVKG